MAIAFMVQVMLVMLGVAVRIRREQLPESQDLEGR